MSSKLDLGTVSLVFGSNLYPDEQCFEAGKTYSLKITTPPGFDKPGVALMVGPTNCGFLREASYDHAMAYVARGFTVKVEVTECGELDPVAQFSHKLNTWQNWCHGKGRCWAEAERALDFDTRVRVELGRVNIEFGSGEFADSDERCFSVGSTYRLIKAETLSGKVGVALESDGAAKHCGWVTSATSKKVSRELDNFFEVQADVVDIQEGKQEKWDSKLKIKRNWWHGVAECWIERRG